jgi:hypothetical protein
MWQTNEQRKCSVERSADIGDLADPAASDIENQVVQAIFRHQCLEQVQTFWQHNLNPTDRRIIMLRWGTTVSTDFKTVAQPIDFKTVAQQMEPGWTEEAVRQRHSRIMRTTRNYLQQQGWLE